MNPNPERHPHVDASRSTTATPAGRPLPELPAPAFQQTILAGLQGRAIYGGTVPPAVVARRRAANKRARVARRRGRR